MEKNRYMDMLLLLEEQVARGDQVNMFPIHEYWLDMENMRDYVQAHQDIDLGI